MKRSYGELKIEDILKEIGYPYELEYIFDDLITKHNKPLRFDFAVFDDDGSIKCLIEYQGEQHYQSNNRCGGQAGLKKQQYNDEQKRLYCCKHNIKLIEIPYWNYERINYDTLLHAIEN